MAMERVREGTQASSSYDRIAHYYDLFFSASSEVRLELLPRSDFIIQECFADNNFAPFTPNVTTNNRVIVARVVESA